MICKPVNVFAPYILCLSMAIAFLSAPFSLPLKITLCDADMNYSLLLDEELVDLMKKEDTDAYRMLYERYWKSIFFTAYRKLKDKEVAEELTQNLFLSLWEKRHEGNIRNFKPWLFTAIRFSVIAHYKSQMVHEKFVDYTKHSSAVLGNETDQPVIQNDLSEAIEKGIAMLPSKTQQVFKLSRFENCTVKEISNVLKISEKAVEYHITQSLKRMRVHLKDYIPYVLILCMACYE